MSIENYMTTSFTPYTLTKETTFPFEDKWTSDTAFNGAIDAFEGDEKYYDNQDVGIVTHIILAPATLTTLVRSSKLVSGTHTYVIKFIDWLTLKPTHHIEIWVEEIT